MQGGEPLAEPLLECVGIPVRHRGRGFPQHARDVLRRPVRILVPMKAQRPSLPHFICRRPARRGRCSGAQERRQSRTSCGPCANLAEQLSSRNDHGYWTTSTTLTECDSGPLAPVIVRVADPVLVCFFVATVRTEGLPGATDAGANVAVTNFGRPETVRVTAL